MTKGIAILAGLKLVSPSGYNGWDGTYINPQTQQRENACEGCELDVDNMHRMLSPLGYTARLLKTQNATAGAILAELNRAAQQLVAGDILVFYFSGHGGQRDDLNGDEIDGKDETLCAYDRPIIDDELDQVWQRFRSGVRIVMLSDSCHSGTNFKSMPSFAAAKSQAQAKSAATMQAQMIHISGCRDSQESGGQPDGGVFTKLLVRLWNGGQFSGTYPQLHQQLCANLPASQQPQYNEYGVVPSQFRNQRPFSIATTSSLRYNAIWVPANDARPFVCGYTLAELQAENGKHYSNGYKMMYQHSYLDRSGQRLYHAIWAPASDGRPIVWGFSLKDFQKANSELYGKGFRLNCQQSYDIGNGDRRYDGIWVPSNDVRPIVWGWTLEHFQRKNGECYRKGYKLMHQQSYDIGNGERRYDGIWAPASDGRPIVWGWTLADFQKKNGDCYASGYKLFHQQSYDIGGGQIRYDGIWAPTNDGRPIIWGYTLDDFLTVNANHSAAGYKLLHFQSY